MAVRFFGDWDKLKLWTRRIVSGAFNSDYEDEMKALSEAITKKLKSHILMQDLPWEPLKASTVKIKGHSLVYIDKRHYMEKINSEMKKKGRFSIEFVVAPMGRHYSGLSMQELGTILEYGTSKTKARPLWRPTFEEVKKMPEFKKLMKLQPKFGFGSVK